MTSTPDTSETAVPAPRRAFGIAIATYVLAALSLAWPALSGQFLVNPRSDQYIAGFAFREFGAATLRGGSGFPLWNPYLFGGMPYVAAMHGDIFYPTFLLRMVLPTDVAMTWGFIIHVFLAGLFTYIFLRSLGLGFFGSLVGGLAYMMSGNIAGLVSPGHDGKVFVSTLLPMALFLIVRGVRDGRSWSWGALAITVGLAVLSPHPQLLQYMLLVCGSFGLFLAFADTGTGALPRSTALRRLGASASGRSPRPGDGSHPVPARARIRPVVAARPWKGLAGGDLVFDAAGGDGQLLGAAVLGHPRSLLGRQPDSPAQRIPGRCSDSPRRTRIRTWPPPGEPQAGVVLRRCYDHRPAVGAGWQHTVLSDRVRARSGNEVLPRAEYDAVRRFIRCGGIGRLRR
jgi:hypothetical protein